MGIYNERDRHLGKEIFKKMMDSTIARKYHARGTETKKGLDQAFLSDHVYPLIKSRSIIHDSYLCMNYKDSVPFPTERIGRCFIGASYVLDRQKDCENTTFFECAVSCRPAEHKNWKFC